MSGGGREGGGERDGKWGEGCRQVGGENRHSQRANEQNHTENGRGKTKQRTNRKRTGNLLIKADRTGDSVLVRIYISPTQTRDGAGSLWPPPLVRCHGTRLRSPPATAPPDSPPRRRPLYGTGSGSCSLPRLYATGINRIDGSPAVGQRPGAGPDVGPAGSEPTGGARCIPLGAVCAAGGGCRSESPVASTWLCGRGALCSPACPWVAACWGQRNQARRRKSISHAMLPSPARPSCAVGFTRVKFKESQQRQLSGLPRTGITASPPQAGIFLGLHLPAAGLCSPGEAPSSSRRGL